MTNTDQRQPVTVVIPNYNGFSLLRKHLPIVLAALSAGDELVIVDDASSDDSVSFLTTTYKLRATARGLSAKTASGCEILLLVNSENQRFGATANRGVLAARHELVILLNNDVSPDKPAITRAVNAYTQDKKKASIFAIGFMEIEPGEMGRPIKGGKNVLWFDRGLFAHARAENFETGKTAWVSGGSGLFVREKWLQLGGFSSTYYPAYWEDIDLSRRAQERGWITLFLASAIVHHSHETTNKSVFSQHELAKISWKNADAFTWNHADFWQKVAYVLWRPYWWWQRNKYAA